MEAIFAVSQASELEKEERDEREREIGFYGVSDNGLRQAHYCMKMS